MGLLSHRVERSELKPGDHIYTWRAAYSYSHHGTCELHVGTAILLAAFRVSGRLIRRREECCFDIGFALLVLLCSCSASASIPSVGTSASRFSQLITLGVFAAAEPYCRLGVLVGFPNSGRVFLSVRFWVPSNLLHP